MAETRIYWIHTLTPTHLGVGRGVDYIDLPIDRDKVTGWPVIRASAFKGVLADHFNATVQGRKNDRFLKAAFGTVDSEEDSGNSGSLMPTDAQLVCLPVRSFRGTFAWVSSPLGLRRLERMLTLAGLKLPVGAPVQSLAENQAHVPPKTCLTENDKLYLEDLDLQAQQCPKAAGWAALLAKWVFPDDQPWQNEFQQRFAVVPDLIFDYLCQTGTEVITRVRIDEETKTVAERMLWTEEALPAESILAGVIQCERVFLANGQANSEITPKKLLDKYATKELKLQIGGKATVGRGQVRCVFTRCNRQEQAQ